jgi:hypothetical protein
VRYHKKDPLNVKDWTDLWQWLIPGQKKIGDRVSAIWLVTLAYLEAGCAVVELMMCSTASFK